MLWKNLSHDQLLEQIELNGAKQQVTKKRAEQSSSIQANYSISGFSLPWPFTPIQESQQIAEDQAEKRLRDDTDNWLKALQQAQLENSNQGLLITCQTPVQLQKLGFAKLPLALKMTTLKKIVSTKRDHNLPLQKLKHLPRALYWPIMIFESATRADSFVILTEIRHEGRFIMVSVAPNKKHGRTNINEITSAYRRQDNAWYIKQIQQGRLLYQNKTKSLAWARTARLQLPMVRKLPTRLSGKTLPTEGTRVNSWYDLSPKPFIPSLNAQASKVKENWNYPII